MINYNQHKEQVILRIGTSFSADKVTPNVLSNATNKAIEYMAERVLWPDFIFDYSFTWDGTTLEYSLPGVFAIYDIYSGTTRLEQHEDWVFDEDALNHEDKIVITKEKITFRTAPTGIITIKYRGLPTLVDNEDESTYSINLPSTLSKSLEPLTAYFIFTSPLRQIELAGAEFAEYSNMVWGYKMSSLQRNVRKPERMSANHRF